jgi:hypothetical protein
MPRMWTRGVPQVELSPWPGATKAVLVRSDDDWVIQWRVGVERKDVTHLREADLAAGLGSNRGDPDTVAYIERRLSDSGLTGTLRKRYRDVRSRHEVAVWHLRPKFR